MAEYKKILIIDDDDISNYVIITFLKRLDRGDEIDIELDGFSALTYLKNAESTCNFPDLIIVDLLMPIMCGYDFLDVYEKKYWNIHKDTKLVIITNSLFEDDRTKVLKYQCVSRFLIKPVNLDILSSYNI